MLLALAATASCRRPPPPPAVPLTADAYVWQRSWTPAVDAAVTSQAPAFGHLVVLAAEVDWHGDEPRVTTVHPDHAALPKSIGIAVRIGPRPGRTFDPATTALLCRTTRAAVAVPAGVTVAELQLDYDCAESKLADYAAALSAVRAAVSPVPVVVTALPSWLKHDAFAAVAGGSFVLQVHSLHAPTGPDAPMTLCDADEARRAVIAADRFGVPFRVALPTYSYVAGFTAAGALLGLSAEGPTPTWPAGTRLSTLRPDPVALAALVRGWQSQRPPHLTGIIWYRLPVVGDALNWRPATLAAVMAGRTPRPHLRADAVRTTAGLTDIALLNDGDADAPPAAVTATWSTGTEVVAADPMPGYDRVDSRHGGVTFLPVAGASHIAPGQRVAVGWVRLTTDTEVHVTPTN